MLGLWIRNATPPLGMRAIQQPRGSVQHTGGRKMRTDAGESIRLGAHRRAAGVGHGGESRRLAGEEREEDAVHHRRNLRAAGRLGSENSLEKCPERRAQAPREEEQWRQRRGRGRQRGRGGWRRGRGGWRRRRARLARRWRHALGTGGAAVRASVMGSAAAAGFDLGGRSGSSPGAVGECTRLGRERGVPRWAAMHAF